MVQTDVEETWLSQKSVCGEQNWDPLTSTFFTKEPKDDFYISPA